MTWWEILILVIVVIAFTVLTIWFSFIYPYKNKKENLEKKLKTEPDVVVNSIADIKLFKSYKYNDVKNISNEEKEYLSKAGVYGFYIPMRIEEDDYIYPIYLASTNNIYDQIQNDYDQLENLNSSDFNNVKEFLLRTNKKRNSIKFFVIEDFDVDSLDYWTYKLNLKTKSFI